MSIDNFLPEGTRMLDMDDPDFADKLEFELWSTGSSSDYRNDRERPYNGQPHTYDGEHGKTEVKGLTLRDIADCFVKGLLFSNGIAQPELYERAENNTWRYQDIYKLDLNNIDPGAAIRNSINEINKLINP